MRVSGFQGLALRVLGFRVSVQGIRVSGFRVSQNGSRQALPCQSPQA